ncbi:MAG TPA: sigma-70 family RNA polymerase sigma factor [Terracidiphilus sp.]|nr:sigma-70 family RNA polymerase sigma factor [Terracidiphilus sp.]
MQEKEWLAEEFERNRGHLLGVAYRILGSAGEADDAVQEAWLRLSRSGGERVENLGGWLTTVVGRVCLDMLRSRTSRREEELDAPGAAEPAAEAGAGDDPERETVMADSVGLAMLVVLETLAPAERVAFVLHDLFDMPFEEIAPVVGKSEMATRQLASRARRRVRGARPSGEADPGRRREIVNAFLTAARGGDFQGLLAILDPNVVVRADAAAQKLGANVELRGAENVAGRFATHARGARPALVGGIAGLAWAPGGKVRVAFNFTIVGGKIAAVELIADPERIGELGVTLEAMKSRSVQHPRGNCILCSREICLRSYCCD